MAAAATSFSSAKCVVTGGAGFIGANVTHALVEAGAHVRVVDRLVDGHGGDRRNLDGLDVDLLECDIGDPAVADALVDVDVIFNVAGQVSHTASMRDPIRDLQLNALSHAAFLETVRRVAPSVRVVHTSTRQVYGRAQGGRVDETQHAQPVDVNGVAKWAGEQLHLVYHHAYGIPSTCLRLTNVYGPRQHLMSDELGFLPVFFRRALTDEPIQLFGDGSQRRDVLHVDDVVSALLAATDPRVAGEVFNVGGRRDHTLFEIARLITSLAGSNHAPVLVPWPDEHRAIDIGSFHTDGSKIEATLGWSASIDLAEGVGSTLAFYRERPWYLSST
ncbi:MAG: NAD-dependent epimerase/dehydratase family protein [Ilumatobacter sp.]